MKVTSTPPRISQQRRRCRTGRGRAACRRSAPTTRADDRELRQRPVRGRRLLHRRHRRDPRGAQRRQQRRHHRHQHAHRERRDDRRRRHADAGQCAARRRRRCRTASASSAPTPMPAPSPITDASSPITTASTSTDPIIWRRLAPIARISASSRVRCATMIENVLRIRKMPTNSATPAKPSRMLLKKLEPLLELLGLRVGAAPRRSSPRSRRRARPRPRRAAVSTLVPGAAVTSIAAEHARLAEHQL